MATPAQLQANRLNALKSTGPRSAEGKAASRFNALKHGSDAESLVIPGEDPEALAELSAEYYEQFRPEGPIELYYVDSMVNSDWLRRRLHRCEAELYVYVRSPKATNPIRRSARHGSATPPVPTRCRRSSASYPRSNANSPVPSPSSAASRPNAGPTRSKTNLNSRTPALSPQCKPPPSASNPLRIRPIAAKLASFPRLPAPTGR